MPETKLNGFTPIIDSIVQDTSLVTASVFGVVWRHCQMRNGVCYKSVEHLADLIGLNDRTVRRHLKELCKLGYIERIERTGKTCVYRVTVKATVQQSIEVEPLTESHPTPDRESPKDTIKDTITTDCLSDNTATPVVEEVDELEPSTESEHLLLDLVNVERKAKRWRRLTKFPSLACKKRYGKCSAQLNIKELSDFIRCALEQGILGLPKVVAYTEGCVNRKGTGPPRSNNGRARPRSNLDATMENVQRELERIGAE